MRGRNLSVGAIVALVALLGGVTFATVADAKKRKKANVVVANGTTGAVPEGPSSRFFAPVPFVGTATIGKKGRKNIVSDIDVTISINAVPAAGSINAMRNLRVRITGPTGATTDILTGGRGVGTISGNLVSNLTLSDETPVQTCGGATAPNPPPPPPPPCIDPHATLFAPFSGTAYPNGGALSTLYGYKMKGTYTLTAFDTCGPGNPNCADRGLQAITGWSIRVKGERL
jgi:hypothetical protein